MPQGHIGASASSSSSSSRLLVHLFLQSGKSRFPFTKSQFRRFRQVHWGWMWAAGGGMRSASYVSFPRGRPIETSNTKITTTTIASHGADRHHRSRERDSLNTHGLPMATTPPPHAHTARNPFPPTQSSTCGSASQAVLSRTQLARHATRGIPHVSRRKAWRKQAMSAWSAKTRRAPSRHCRDA